MRNTLALMLSLVFAVQLNTASAKPDEVDGFSVPYGRIPQEIVDNRYPRSYFPGTEKLGDAEMRITAIGTGMPNQSPSNVAASFLVDIGTGATDRLAGLEADYAAMDKVFVGHLHTDHVGDLAGLWVSGWLNGRYKPLHVYGPSGSSPELGTKVHVDHIRAAWAWDTAPRGEPATGLMSKWLKDGTLKGFNPPPTQSIE